MLTLLIFHNDETVGYERGYERPDFKSSSLNILMLIDILSFADWGIGAPGGRVVVGRRTGCSVGGELRCRKVRERARKM